MNLQTTLYEYQQVGVDKLVKSRVAALFMKPGRGKTRVAIEFVYLRRSRINRVVWFCPVSIKTTIDAEIRKHTDATDDNIYLFDEHTSQRTLPLDRTWYIIGIESMSASARVVLAANRLITTETFVILDESSYIKGHHALRTRRITAMAERAKYRLILTGTPMSQGVVDLYAQMRFLSPKILGYASFYSFAANHLEYSKEHKGMIVRSHNIPYLVSKIAPYIYQISDEDDATLNLPGKLYDDRYYKMTNRQRELYEAAKEKILIETPDEMASIMIYRLFTALQQIVCGYWQDGDTRHTIPHERVNVLANVIDDIGANEKIVIWAKYHYSIAQIVERLCTDHGADTVAQYHGLLDERARECELQRWRQEARFLVATQATGGHGLDMVAGHYAIFYANGFKYAEREQAEDRQHRIGQAQPVTYIDLVCVDSIDMRIAKSLAKKGNAVEDFRRQVQRMKNSSKAELRELVMSL